MKLGRNALCPCGSGAKVKRCHEELVGQEERAGRWYVDTQQKFELLDEYEYQKDADWSAKLWKETGCPYDACPHQTEQYPNQLGGCAARCGV